MSASYRPPQRHSRAERMYSPRLDRQVWAVPDDGSAARSAIEWDGGSLTAYCVWAADGRCVHPLVLDHGNGVGLARQVSRESGAPAYIDAYVYTPGPGECCEFTGDRERVDASGWLRPSTSG